MTLRMSEKKHYIRECFSTGTMHTRKKDPEWDGMHIRAYVNEHG